jgi:hypothetical protein
LFIEPSYFSYPISYTSCIIIVQNEWHIFIHPICAPCCGCVPCTTFWVSASDKYARKFLTIKQQHVSHEIVSWDSRLKHVISTCRLCHGTAMSGYHNYVIKVGWSVRTMADFKVWCVLHQWKSSAS